MGSSVAVDRHVPLTGLVCHKHNADLFIENVGIRAPWRDSTVESGCSAWWVSVREPKEGVGRALAAGVAVHLATYLKSVPKRDLLSRFTTSN